MSYCMSLRLRVCSPADTPAGKIARDLERKILDRVNSERKAVWPVITPENVSNVLAWQEARIRELREETR